jgi:type II secretory pathway pseudopilin PulG
VERKKTGLTIIELLIVLGIISLLVGLLIPALSVVKKTARETKQKAQFGTIELALAAFKNDDGDYPPSDWTQAQFGGDYFGAQKLAEALLGWDLLGFHPNSAWRADGLDAGSGPGTYDPAKARDNNGDGVPDTLNERKGPYLELATTSAFRVRDLFRPNLLGQGPLLPDTFVICDAFGTKKILLANGKIVRAGAPVLYYRANTSQKIIRRIYNAQDNDALVQMKQQVDGRLHPLTDPTNQFPFFYDEYIRDPKIEARPWPYRPDSYILISAGADGLYGTSDDIRNFGN